MTPSAFAQAPPAGSGPYPAIIEGDPGLPGHTIYRPADLGPFGPQNPLPVMAWGNGGCANSSQMHAPFLVEVASHGYLVVAIGPYREGAPAAKEGMTGGGTKSAQLLEALDWATAENRRSGSRYSGKVAPAKFAVAGMSCGGLQALEVSPDPRVATTLVMNSGILNTPFGAPKEGMPKAPPSGGAPKTGAPPKAGAAPKMMMSMPAVDKALLRKLHAPVFYVIGGEKDIAFPNATDDFAKIDTVPVAMANFDVGHGGTYMEPNGGEFGKVASAWLKWQLKGDETAGKMFTGPACGLCVHSEWKFEKKRIP
ncbi:MAG: alpha/beta hydrolase [Acidobacteria bacterium]|nr:alpha/beta hydrolase [Acidobacteriota bacterium]